MNDEFSTTMRMYLAEVYRLQSLLRVPDGFVSTSALADVLEVSAPAVNRMVTKLRELGLLRHEPYQGISLTESGQREAFRHLRRHRIAEAFLVNVMGFGWHEVYEEADRMSAALSESLVTRMAQMAGAPDHCPHGEPIPSAAGDIPDMNDGPLSAAEAERDYTITRVRTREADRLEYIEALGLLPGTAVHLIHIAPFSGPLQLKLGNEYRIIGHNLAEMMYVRGTE